MLVYARFGIVPQRCPTLKTGHFLLCQEFFNRAPTVSIAKMFRTARRLADGKVYLKRVFEPSL